MKLRDSLRVKFDTLKSNGMPYYGQYDWGGTTWLSGIGVRCGAIHKPGGMPHLDEHLLARECNKYSAEEVDLIFERYMGGPDELINVRIDRATTFFGHDSLYSREDMLRALDLLANLFKDRLITAEGILSEKAAVHQEYWLYGMDNIPDWVDNLLHQTVYDVNPARNRIDCEPEALRRYTSEEILRFVGRYHNHRNSFLVLLGPKMEEVKKIAKEHFDDWTPDISPRLKLNHSEDFPILRTVKPTEKTRAGIGQTHFAIGFPTENYLSKDREMLHVLSRMLAYRVRRRLRDENTDFDKGVYRAISETPCSFMHGMITLWYASRSHQFILDSEAVVLEEIRRLKTDLVDPKELDAMVYSLERKYLSAFRDTPGALAELIIEAVCNGDDELENLHSYLDRLQKVTRKRLRDVANKYFTDGYGRVIVKPELKNDSK